MDQWCLQDYSTGVTRTSHRTRTLTMVLYTFQSSSFIPKVSSFRFDDFFPAATHQHTYTRDISSLLE